MLLSEGCCLAWKEDGEGLPLMIHTALMNHGEPQLLFRSAEIRKWRKDVPD